MYSGIANPYSFYIGNADFNVKIPFYVHVILNSRLALLLLEPLESAHNLASLVSLLCYIFIRASYGVKFGIILLYLSITFREIVNGLSIEFGGKTFEVLLVLNTIFSGTFGYINIFGLFTIFSKPLPSSIFTETYNSINPAFSFLKFIKYVPLIGPYSTFHSSTLLVLFLTS